MARQAAYELVQRNGACARATRAGDFRALLAADPDVAARLPAGEIDRGLRPRTPPAPRRRDHRSRAAADEEHHDLTDDDPARAARRTRSTSTDFPELGEKYEGKVRDNYTQATASARSSSPIG